MAKSSAIRVIDPVAGAVCRPRERQLSADVGLDDREVRIEDHQIRRAARGEDPTAVRPSSRLAVVEQTVTASTSDRPTRPTRN